MNLVIYISNNFRWRPKILSKCLNLFEKCTQYDASCFNIIFYIIVLLCSAVFKAPKHLQLRVGRRPCNGPKVDTKILKKIEI